MTKSDLARALVAHNDLTLQKAEETVNLFFAAIAETLSEGEKVEIRGFGSFTVREYGAYMGHNPKTKEKIEVKPKKSPFFKPSRELHGRLNRGAK